MTIPHRFVSSDGLIPSTIFDAGLKKEDSQVVEKYIFLGGEDVDVSEEMEEIRESLYDLIKNKFPRGVAADHLANIYTEEYVDVSNWCD